ncbi:MAG TPA: acyloxyacyl hydrolase [Chthoniobacterales bacterium]|nr:acyloxyacyl hydrolase [Chthoniobacterales bacterium]
MKPVAWIAAIVLLGSVSAPAQDARRFNGGAKEFENLVGAFFLFDRGGNERVTVDYALYSGRFGIMLYSPTEAGPFSGNTEFLAELFAGPIFYGPGDFAGGGSLLLRYNFFRPGARVVPYVQGGGGFVYTDIEPGEASSNAVSTEFNFNLQATFGIRWILNDRWSFLTEATYRHISNAGLSDPNYGIDQAGGSVGVGFSF